METSTLDLRAHIPALAARWRAGVWNDAEFAAIYFLHYQIAEYGPRFASRTQRASPKPQAAQVLDTVLTTPHPAHVLIDLFSTHHFLHVIPNVNHAFGAWLRGTWDIQLYEHIPTPLEVLHLQALGKRPATVVCHYPRMLQKVLSKRDGLHFLTHDLEHAYKYFHDPELHALQRQFFQTLFTMANAGAFGPYLKDAQFSDKFDYLISDMNTHVAHGVHYLRAILIEHALRVEGKAPNERLTFNVHQEIISLLKKIADNAGVAWEEILPIKAFAS